MVAALRVAGLVVLVAFAFDCALVTLPLPLVVAALLLGLLLLVCFDVFILCIPICHVGVLVQPPDVRLPVLTLMHRAECLMLISISR